jgi:lysylphosphatidylglycerol synthetase-like protein (DUF2156 family)
MPSALALLHKIIQFIINPIIILLFAAAVVVFLYGVFEYVKDSGSDDARSTGQKHILSGVFGLFIMISVFGIVQLILHTVGASPDSTGVSDVIGR